MTASAGGRLPLRLSDPAARWAVAASVLGSGAVFVESTVVNVALPALGREFDLGVAGLQWLVNGYLVTLSALLLLGGALGDALGQKRVFEVGLVGFAATSLLCALAPTFPLLIAARFAQGAAGALLVPTSLAFLDTAFAESDRGEAIGRWAGWSAVSTAVGPLLGGVLVDYASWRWVFASAVPLAAAALWIARTRVPSPPRPRREPVDVLGAVVVSVALAAIVWALIEGAERGATGSVILAGGGGVGLALVFLRVEAVRDHPLLPLGIFRSRQFTGANVTTLLVYAALGALFFFLMVQLQSVMGYSGLAAGASLLPINALMLVLSPRAGRWAQRAGPHVLIAAGSVVAGLGMLLFTRLQPGASYAGVVLPAVVLFGAGLGLLVAPLTAAVLAVAEEGRTGVASAVNNATARLAGLLATALVPLAVGIGGLDDISGAAFSAGFRRAMFVGAGLCLAGGVVAWLTVREVGEASPAPHPDPSHGCPRRRAAAGAAGRG